MTVHGPQASLTKIQQPSNHSVPAYRRTGALQIAVRLLTELERGAQALQCCVSVRYGTGQKGPVRVSSCLLLRASPLWSDRGEALVMKSRSHHLLFLLIATGNCRAGTQASCIFRTWGRSGNPRTVVQRLQHCLGWLMATPISIQTKGRTETSTSLHQALYPAAVWLEWSRRKK